MADWFSVPIRPSQNVSVRLYIDWIKLWLACGQSNMALTVYMDMDRENILANANNSNLRFFLEPTYPAGQTGAQPLNPNYDVEGAYWGKGNDVNAVNKMSAVAYSFAKNI